MRQGRRPDEVPQGAGGNLHRRGHRARVRQARRGGTVQRRELPFPRQVHRRRRLHRRSHDALTGQILRRHLVPIRHPLLVEHRNTRAKGAAERQSDATPRRALHRHHGGLQRPRSQAPRRRRVNIWKLNRRGEFIFILVRAISTTSCFVNRSHSTIGSSPRRSTPRTGRTGYSTRSRCRMR